MCGERGAEVAAKYNGAHVLSARVGAAAARRGLHVLAHERGQVAGAGDQTPSALLGLRFVLTFLDPPFQLVAPLVDADLGLLAPADLDAAETGVVERLGGGVDERPALPAAP